MNNLSGNESGELIYLFAYGLLLLLYLIILKLFMNCIDELMSKSHTLSHKSVIDLQIRQEAANRHTDDKTHTFDAYRMAITFVKIVILLCTLTGIFVLLIIKLNIFFALGMAVLMGIVAWQVNNWRNGKGKEVVRRSEDVFIQMGGYSLGSLVILGIALILISVGLILLPA